MSELEDAVHNLEAAVTRKREEVAAVQAEMEELRQQPLPASEALGRLQEYIERRAAEYRHDAAIAALTSATARPRSLVTPDTLEPLLCWLLGDTLRDRLAAELEKTDTGGVSTHERSAQAAELAERKFQLEAEEEQLIRQAEAAGLTIERRADADPRVVLQP